VDYSAHRHGNNLVHDNNLVSQDTNIAQNPSNSLIEKKNKRLGWRLVRDYSSFLHVERARKNPSLVTV
jgi:hypothetical protein